MFSPVVLANADTKRMKLTSLFALPTHELTDGVRSVKGNRGQITEFTGVECERAHGKQGRLPTFSLGRSSACMLVVETCGGDKKHGRCGMTHVRIFLFVASSATTSACIGPQGGAPCECPCQNAATASHAAASSKDEPTAAPSEPQPIPDPVVPTGVMIWDGAGIANLPNIEPPGSWFVYSDKTPTGVKKPPSVEEFTSAIENGAIHTTGKGYTEWGGGIGTNLVGAALLTPVDATKYKGFRFKASGSTKMKFLVATVETMPEFGRCKKCYDHFMVTVSDLSSQMKTYSFEWGDLKQTGWGDKAKLDPKRVVALNFTSKDAVPWDFTIDDVAFLE